MRWYGNVGFGISKKTKPGIFEEVIEEHPYSGEAFNRNVYNRSGNEIIKDVDMNMNIEFVADPFAYQNYMHIKYVEYMNAKWCVTSINPNDYPRIKLGIGGLYEK